MVCYFYVFVKDRSVEIHQKVVFITIQLLQGILPFTRRIAGKIFRKEIRTLHKLINYAIAAAAFLREGAFSLSAPSRARCARSNNQISPWKIDPIFAIFLCRFSFYANFNHFSVFSPIQMWYLQKSASDCARISSKMALKDTDLWWLTAF